MTPVQTGTGLNFQSTNITISATPSNFSNLLVIVNGQIQYLGDGVNSTASSAECYFSADNGLTAKFIFNVTNGDELYWNGHNSGFDLSITDKISIIYES